MHYGEFIIGEIKHAPDNFQTEIWKVQNASQCWQKNTLTYAVAQN